MTIEVFHRLLKANEFGEAKKLAIQLKLSDQIIADAIRLKKSENGPSPYKHQRNFWEFHLEHDTFWGEEDFKRAAEAFKESVKKQ